MTNQQTRYIETDDIRVTGSGRQAEDIVRGNAVLLGPGNVRVCGASADRNQHLVRRDDFLAGG